MGDGDGGDELPEGLLPEGAPPELVAFGRCTSDEVILDVTDLGWLPPPGGVDAAVPEVEVQPAGRDGAYRVTAVWIEVIRFELTVEVIDGVLTVDTSLLPPPVRRDIEHWLELLDGHLEAHGKELAELGFNGRQARLRKVTRREPVLQPGESVTDHLDLDITDSAIAGTFGAEAVEARRDDEPVPPGESVTDLLDLDITDSAVGGTFGADALEARREPGRRWVAAAAGAAVVAVVLVVALVALGGDDDGGEAGPTTAGASDAPATTAPPGTDAPTSTSAAPDDFSDLFERAIEDGFASLADDLGLWPGWDARDPGGDVTGEGGIAATYVHGDVDVVRVMRPEERVLASVVEELGCGDLAGALVVCGADPVPDVDHVVTIVQLQEAVASGDASFYQYVLGFRSTEDPADDLQAPGVLDGVDAWLTAARAGGPEGTFALTLLQGPAGLPAPTSARLVVSDDVLFFFQPVGPLTMGELRAGALAFDDDGPPPLGFDVLPDTGFLEVG